jgi:hypothetical protein
VSTSEQYLKEKIAVPVYKSENTAVGIRHADHVTPSIRKIRTDFVDKRRSLGPNSSLRSLSFLCIRQLNIDGKQDAAFFSAPVENLSATALHCPLTVHTMEAGVPHKSLHAVKCSFILDVRINT